MRQIIHFFPLPTVWPPSAVFNASFFTCTEAVTPAPAGYLL